MDDLTPRQKILLAGYLTIPELMAELSRTRQTIYNLFGRGMPFVQIGSIRLVKIDEARSWLASQRVDRSPRRPGRPGRPPKIVAPDMRPHVAPAPATPPSASTGGANRIQRTK